MAKQVKKPAKKASETFLSIMAASVKVNPTPINKSHPTSIKAYVFNCTNDSSLKGYALEKEGNELIKNTKWAGGWDFFETIDLPIDSGIYQILEKNKFATTMRIE